MGTTGNLVPQSDKVGTGCLCFAPPGGKKAQGQSQAIATDAPMYVGPAATGQTPATRHFSDIAEALDLSGSEHVHRHQA